MYKHRQIDQTIWREEYWDRLYSVKQNDAEAEKTLENWSEDVKSEQAWFPLPWSEKEKQGIHINIYLYEYMNLRTLKSTVRRLVGRSGRAV
jgi:hypothetical protein